MRPHGGAPTRRGQRAHRPGDLHQPYAAAVAGGQAAAANRQRPQLLRLDPPGGDPPAGAHLGIDRLLQGLELLGGRDAGVELDVAEPA